jgi:hypothetical protein
LIQIKLLYWFVRKIRKWRDMTGKSFTSVFQYSKQNVFFLFEVLTMELKRISQALLIPVLLSGIVFAPQADAADDLSGKLYADSLAKTVSCFGLSLVSFITVASGPLN